MKSVLSSRIYSLAQLGPLLLLLVPTRILAADCGGVPVSDALGSCGAPAGTNPVFALVEKVITYATGLLGLVLVLMIVIAGLEYVISGGNPEKAKGAKRRIEQAATGFVLFVVMWGVLQVLLPGGIFRP
jgi:Type IV secretion system pilin